MRNARWQQVRQNSKMRQLVYMTCGILLFFYLTFSLIFGDNGLLRYFELKLMRDGLLAETEVMEKQNDDIGNQVERLKNDPEVIEGLAREYGLTKDGEMVFKFKEKE